MTISQSDSSGLSRKAQSGDSAASLKADGTPLETTPSTPPRGRTASRYPTSLTRGDPGRIPLHRRGTSKTYERLEDLLREAGYKETRIFTPEAERAEARPEERRKSSVRDSVDAVVGYLAGWMPGAGRSQEVADAPGKPAPGLLETTGWQDDRSRWSLPPSPLSGKRNPQQGTRRTHSPSLPSPSASSTTIVSMRSDLSNSSHGRTVSNRHPRVRQMKTSSHPLRPQSSASGNLRAYAQVSAAQGYLRHMASAPNMPKRLPSTRSSSVERLSIYFNGEEAPALPPRWLESVTKAVLGSSHAGVHVGGPQASRQPLRLSSRAPLSKKESKFTLSDQTNKPPRASGGSASGLPPGLMSYMLRAETAPSEVSAARVICRSAPGSRSSSRVGDRTGYGSLRGQSRNERAAKGGKRARGDKCDGVPVLASTRIENDTWATHWVNGRRVPLVASGADDEESECDYDDDDDDDGELDFARLLVPPKRQYSIQSLRRHLYYSRNEIGRQGGLWEDDADSRNTRGRSRRGSIDDGEGYGWEALGVPGFDRAPSKRRSGIPGGWTNFTAGRA
ncbi:hypothetical protein AcV5_000268 [Taiwanofungus camphoratus]|nr:hypothetical protein AcV5_000268 [Antrodia cinnamomea]